MNILITVGVVLVLVFGKTLVKLSVTRKRVAREIEQDSVPKIDNPGTIQSLTLLPLIDFFSDDSRYKTEAGVSYHITADDTRLLMDVGANAKKEHPSPLMSNMELAGIRFDELDALYISHSHLDHVGGMKEQKQKQFSISSQAVTLPTIPVYTPEHIIASAKNPGPETTVLASPQVIKDGIVSMGAMPRALYLLGYTLEQSLAFNVEGKGIVIVIGCGHQTIERILERARALFDEPIYGIIGGLHLPAGGGRMKIGPIDIQPIVGTDRYPWDKIDDRDTESAIAAVKEVNPELIALSPHDSSDRSLNRFKEVFGDKFQVINVGQPIVV